VKISVILFSLSLLALPLDAGIQVSNGDFRHDLSDWTMINEAPQPEKVTLSWDGQEGRRTPGCARFESEAADAVFGLGRHGENRLPFDPNASKHIVSLWVKTDGGIDVWLEAIVPDVVINSIDYRHNHPVLAFEPPETENGWTRLLVALPKREQGSAIHFSLKARGRGTVWVDDLTIETEVFDRIEVLAESSYQTEIRSSDGRPRAVVVAPRGSVEERIGRTLAKKWELPLIEEPQVLQPLPHYPFKDIDSDTHLILLSAGQGGPVVQALRRATWIVEDERVPGEGGYAIRTIPRPFARSSANVIVLAGGDETALRKASEVFAPSKDEAGNLVFDKFLTMQPGPKWQAVRSRWYELKTDDPWFEYYRKIAREQSFNGRAYGIHLAQIADRYWLSGNDEFARIYKELIDRQLFGTFSEGSSNSDHMGLFYLVRSWDRIENSPVFSPEDRLRITNYILDCIDGWQGYPVRSCFSAARLTYPLRVRQNHWVILSNGMTQGYLYFWRLYGLERAEEWMRWAEDIAADALGWGGPEDSANYQLRTFAEVSRHYRWQGLSTRNQPGTEHWLEYARRFIAIHDNFAMPSTFGDSYTTHAMYLPDGRICGDDVELHTYRDGLIEWLVALDEDWDFAPARWMLDRVIKQRRKLNEDGYNPVTVDLDLEPQRNKGIDVTTAEFAWLFGSNSVGKPDSV
jgi:hypothetical protein